MSQSISLTKALKLADKLLVADTGDLVKLAKITGIPPEVLYYKADLTGIDLREQDIEFLFNLEVDYLGAKLNERQLRAFRAVARQKRQNSLRSQKKLDRIERVRAFLDESLNDQRLGLSKKPVRADFLQWASKFLLQPLEKVNLPSDELPPIFINNILGSFSTAPFNPNIPFLKSLFNLMNEIDANVDNHTVEFMQAGFFDQFGERLGFVIAEFKPTAILDIFWTVRDNFEDTLNSVEQINHNRPLHADAVESILEQSRILSWSFPQLIEFLNFADFNCSVDQAERIASYLVRAHWPSKRTRDVLEIKANNRVRNAVFRQILGQGQEDRVAEIIRWLNQNEGKAGALSLENAFIHIENFDPAMKLANEIAPHLAQNQLDVVARALRRVSRSKEHAQRVDAFLRRFASS